MVQRVSLTQGQIALVDDEDFEWLSDFKWYAVMARNTGTFYALTSVVTGIREGRTVRGSRQMQRVILDPDRVIPRSQKTDHINRDTLDNRRSNLRWTSDSISNINRGMHANNTSGYRGVFFDRKCKNWRAQIKINNVKISSERCQTLISAALAYNELAIRYHGEHAQLNTIREDNDE